MVSCNLFGLDFLYLMFPESIYSFAVYFGSSVYSPASEGVMKEFGVGNVAASLGLAIYVLACRLRTIPAIMSKN